MKCYLCEKELNDINAENTNNHKEHIIPNAIGGRLKVQDILCSTCGSNFGKDIDKNFVKIFFPFTERIHLAKERGENDNTVKGSMMLDGALRQVSFKNMKVFPGEPFSKIDEQNKIVYIYAYSEKIAKNYINKVKNDLIKDGKDTNIFEFKCVDDLSGEVDYEFKLDNQSFVLGLNKIATEFAILNNIGKHELTRSLDIQTKQIIDTKNIYPYFPLGKFEKAIELIKPYIDDSYPAHHLILFTEKINSTKTKLLICYIELFSTFQYYIILNDDYKGRDIHESYYQTVLKQKISEINVENYDIKDLMIVCQENDIPFEGTIDELKIAITKKLSVGKSYEKKFSDSLDSIIKNFITPLSFSLHKNKLPHSIKNLPYFENEEIKKTLKILSDLDEDDLLNILLEMRNLFLNDDDTVNIKPFRKYYLGSSDVKVYYSYILELPEFLSKNMEQLKKYTNFKFYMLNDFTTINLLQRKIEMIENTHNIL